MLVLNLPFKALMFLTLMRSEERFSRNAETDLVCRLLLEKKKGDVSVRGLDDDRLGVLEDARSGRGITNVADPVVPAKVHEFLLREHLVHEAHAPLGLHLAVVHREARGLLAAVLEDPQAGVEVGRHRCRARAAECPTICSWA